MPTTDELKAFLAKRGYPAIVYTEKDCYVICLKEKNSADKVVDLLVQIKEPGKFIVSFEMEKSHKASIVGKKKPWWKIWGK
jgi:hypothetical protein